MTGTPRDDLAGFIRDELQEAADGRQDVAYEQIEAYVDGALDDVDREIFETRLADNPGLRAMVEDLRALRPALAPTTASPARVVTFEPRPTPAPHRSPRALDRPSSLAAAGGARRGGSGGPAPVAAVDAGSDAAVAGAAAAAAAAATPARAGRSRVAGVDGGAAGPRPHRGADERRDAGRLQRLRGDLQSRLTETLQQGRLPASSRAAQTVARDGELMSSDVRATPFVPVGPRATAVSSATPAFRWTALAGATTYRVRVVDDRLTTVAVSDPITTLTWRPEAPLPSRRVLTWQVEAATPDGARTTPEPPLAEARFTVLTPSERAGVSEALATAGGSDLASAVVYAEAGLYDDADAALTRVQRANPESPMAAALKADLSMRRFGRIAGR